MFAAGCLSGDGGTAEPETPEPSMDAALTAIVNANDPERAAAERNVPYREGAVRIEILLTEEPTNMPPEVRSVNVRRGDRVDAYVPVDELQALAVRDTVRWLQPIRTYDQQLDFELANK